MTEVSSEFLKITDIVANIATVTGIIVIIVGLFSYIIEKKNLNFTAVQHCIKVYKENYQNIGVNDIDKIKQYTSFINEELFYFEKKYLPYSIADEWLDGLIDFVPVFNSSGTFVNEMKALPNVVHEVMDGKMPSRIRRIFTIRGDYNVQLIYSRNHNDSKAKTIARKGLVKEIKHNLGYRWWKRFL